MIAPQTLKRLAVEFREYTEYELAIEALYWRRRLHSPQRATARAMVLRIRFEVARRGTDGR